MRPSISTQSNSASRRLVVLAFAALGFALVQPAVRAAEGDRPASSADVPRGGGQRLTEGVAGQVVDVSGAPLAGVLVVPSALGGGAGPVPEMAVQTDAAGGFEWSLRPGRYRLDAIQGGRTIGSTLATVERSRVATVSIRAGVLK